MPRRKRKPFRLKPKVVVTNYSNGYYPNENNPRRIVVHSTEGPNLRGVRDLVSLGQLFKPRSFSASCHVGVDDDGHSGRYVRDKDAAWHVSEYNTSSLGIEHVGFAAQRRWSRKERREAARWIAQWSHEYGIPLRHSTSHGVCRHKDLGGGGGGHVDPGPGYPLRRTLAWALVIRELRYRGRRRKR